MRNEYKKLKSILRKSLSLQPSGKDLNQNLAEQLCDWEVDYLLAKVENEFNVELPVVAAPNHISVNQLLRHISKARN
ncbi:acyl carrier protein [Panacibacter sp. DH6]|uniref:Acyl carrier protein n=1 Tax=Panacibacter microcysteis TaxID=2793269 RepID=A0A931E495_9BACT|nr:acyl carrier protein [Panacibacter microcysteis]MBG9377370.1 acyl carrier protein [Panacibacter microcysteis]